MSKTENKPVAEIPRAGDVLEYTRVISRRDIADFAELSGDFGNHHGGGPGPAMAHGLLIASLVTKIGGDMNYISRRMDMEFLAPVYEGDSVTGRVTIERILERATRVKLWMLCECIRSDGTIAIRGRSQGQIVSDLMNSRTK